MKNEERLAVVAAGVRWASNILTELGGSHSKVMPPEAQEELLRAISSLSWVQMKIAESAQTTG